MRRKELLTIMSGVPGWVRAKYGAASVMPDVAADFAGDRYWDRRFGPQSLAQMFAVSRTSDAYADDTSGAFALFPSGIIARTNKGLHAWEGSTNSLRNNSMQGPPVVGNPGTLPANWASSLGSSGLSREITGFGTINGLDYIDIRFFVASGAGGTSNAALTFETATGTAAASGETWTGSLYAALMDGSLQNVTNIDIRWSENDSGGAQVLGATSSTNLATMLSASIQRFSATRTLSGGASVAHLQHFLRMTVTAGDVNFTLRVLAPQLEQKAFATPPVRTAGAAVARAADVVSLVSLPPLGPAYSMVAAGAPRTPLNNAANQVIAQLSTGLNANRFQITRVSLTAQMNGFVNSGANTQYNQSAAGAVAPDVMTKSALAATPNDQQFVRDTVFASSSSGASMPINPDIFTIGAGVGGLQWGGIITDFAFWRGIRLPNAALQAITA
jgi:hypothetical protein